MRKTLIAVVGFTVLASSQIASAACNQWGKVTHIAVSPMVVRGANEGYVLIGGTPCVFSGYDTAALVTVLTAAMTSGRDAMLQPVGYGGADAITAQMR